jgi:transposase-like protein
MVNESVAQTQSPCGKEAAPLPKVHQNVSADKTKAPPRSSDAVLPADVGTRIALIQALIPLGLMAVEEALQQEVEHLAGPRYARTGGRPGHVRWSKERGSVYLLDQKVPITYQRVRDQRMKTEAPLVTYSALQQPRQMDDGLLRRVLLGLSCRRYEECAAVVPQAFGLSPSAVSRRFIRASARKLKQVLERRLDGYDFVALVLDGKTFGDDELVIALGITVSGQKVVLGFVQTATENRTVCAAFLRELVARGLRYTPGLLVVLDGSKGLRSAVQDVFGDAAQIQRCQWHKRENVVSHLPKRQQATWRQKLQRAYEQPTYAEAKAQLEACHRELRRHNESAARSLTEGLEETLTLHQLGVFEALGPSLKTTNLLESIMACVEQRTGKVDHWKTSDQKQRWLAAALLDIEPRLRRLRSHRALPRLRQALQRALGKEVAAA